MGNKMLNFTSLINWYSSDGGTNISTCCNVQGDKDNPMTLPKTQPFYLLPILHTPCQQANIFPLSAVIRTRYRE